MNLGRFGVGKAGLLAGLFFLGLAAGLARGEELKAQELRELPPTEVKKPEEVQEVKPEDRVQFSAGVDVLSQYVFRGVALSRDGAVFQPSFTLSYKGLAANIWGNFDTSERIPARLAFQSPNPKDPKWTETDFTLSYSREVSKNLTLTAGLIYYGLDRNAFRFDSTEIYGGFTYKLPWLDFGAAAYREIGHYPGTYLNWFITRSFALPFAGASLDLWASWATEFSDDNADAFPIPGKPGEYYRGLHAGHLMATVNFPVGKYVKISPKVMYWYALGGDSTGVISNLSWDGKHNHVLGGAALSASF
jgi:uncharacterized protein (TIGR02001 family)